MSSRLAMSPGIVIAIVMGWLLAGCQNPPHGSNVEPLAVDGVPGIQASDVPARGKWKEWLEPAPTDQPQPEFWCARPDYTAAAVWYDRETDFSWEIANNGWAPLRMHVDT